jgi:hypothetical protein
MYLLNKFLGNIIDLGLIRTTIFRNASSTMLCSLLLLGHIPKPSTRGYELVEIVQRRIFIRLREALFCKLLSSFLFFVFDQIEDTLTFQSNPNFQPNKNRMFVDNDVIYLLPLVVDILGLIFISGRGCSRPFPQTTQ